MTDEEARDKAAEEICAAFAAECVFACRRVMLPERAIAEGGLRVMIGITFGNLTREQLIELAGALWDRVAEAHKRASLASQADLILHLNPNPYLKA